MSSKTVLGEPTPSSVHPEIAGRRDRVPPARAIAARMPGMTVVARAPSPPLAPFVEWIAYYDVAPSLGWRELVLPTGTMLLVVNMAERKFRWQDGDARVTAHDSHGAMLLAPPLARSWWAVPVVLHRGHEPDGSARPGVWPCPADRRVGVSLAMAGHRLAYRPASPCVVPATVAA